MLVLTEPVVYATLGADVYVDQTLGAVNRTPNWTAPTDGLALGRGAGDSVGAIEVEHPHDLKRLAQNEFICVPVGVAYHCHLAAVQGSQSELVELAYKTATEAAVVVGLGHRGGAVPQ